MRIPKYAGMLVKGKPVTPDQALIILYSTQHPWREYNEPFIDDPKGSKIALIALEHLSNDFFETWNTWGTGNDCWIQPNGTIFADHLLVGKYATVEEIVGDLKLLAINFPFLEMSVQLLNRQIYPFTTEYFDPEDEEYRGQFLAELRGGHVTVSNPDWLLCKPRYDNTSGLPIQPRINGDTELLARAKALTQKYFETTQLIRWLEE